VTFVIKKDHASKRPRDFFTFRFLTNSNANMAAMRNFEVEEILTSHDEGTWHFLLYHIFAKYITILQLFFS